MERSDASSISRLETEVLGEYTRMLNALDRMSGTAHSLSLLPPEILAQFTPLERKMGLALTLFKASVWAVLVQRRHEEEERMAAAAQQQQQQGQQGGRGAVQSGYWAA